MTLLGPQTIQAGQHVICHGLHNAVHYSFFAKEGIINTGQPSLEQFDNITDAQSRLVELGVSLGTDSRYWPREQQPAIAEDGTPLVDVNGHPRWQAERSSGPWQAGESYPLGAVVEHQGRTWLHISDKQGEPDQVFDVAAWTGDWVPVQGRV